LRLSFDGAFTFMGLSFSFWMTSLLFDLTKQEPLTLSLSPMGLIFTHT